MVKIRIAVVVNDQGHWNASGFWKFSDDEAYSVVNEGLDEASFQESLYWVEAEVPVPETSAVQGKVVS